jgi:putative membrane protein
MDWIEAFHIIFMVAWMVTLIMLPRLINEPANTTALQGRLMNMGHVAMLATIALGVWLLITHPGYLSMGWMHAKLTLVVALVVFHGWCWQRVRSHREGQTMPAWAGTAPIVALVLIVSLAVVKPF